jgi:hypothetical protein
VDGRLWRRSPGTAAHPTGSSGSSAPPRRPPRLAARPGAAGARATSAHPLSGESRCLRPACPCQRLAVAWRGARPCPDLPAPRPCPPSPNVWPFGRSGPAAADLGGPPGLALHPHGLGQHPRQRRERGRELGVHSGQAASSRFGGEAPRLCTRIKNGVASRPLRLHGPAPHPVGLRCQAAHDVTPSLARGHAERRRSGACPQQALILDPCPLAPRRAGSAAHAPNPEHANTPAAPQN